MAVYDVNGDGLMDVVAALEAHGWGLAWFEQKRDAAGAITFVEHMIMDDYSDQERRRRHVLRAARLDIRGHERRRHSRLHRRQARLRA